MPPIRPPWTTEMSVTAHCTGCQLCLTACPEGILFKGKDRRPEVNFAGNECTFCGECARVCSEPVFQPLDQPPWPLKAEITSGCLTRSGVACDLCQEVCPVSALVQDFSTRPPQMDVDPELCTGCGACLSICPKQAILIEDPRRGAPFVK